MDLITLTDPRSPVSEAYRTLRTNLDDYLSGGGRKIDAWYADLKVIEVAFDDEADAFGNFNTLAELTAAEKDG